VNADDRLARLRWRCRRGVLELDLALEQILECHYGALTEPERRLFEELLATPDWELLSYLHGDSEPTNGEMRKLVRKIR